MPINILLVVITVIFNFISFPKLQMVTLLEFNRIKKENPESKIWKRTWEEQNIRNKLAKTLIKARKKWVSHPYNKQLELKNSVANKTIKDLEWKLLSKNYIIAELEEQLMASGCYDINGN